MNLYAYCGNSPIGFIDPTGLSAEGGSGRYIHLQFPYGTGDPVLVPPGVDVYENMRRAAEMNNPFAWRKLVDHGGEWDYKRMGSVDGSVTHPEYEAFGNLNYGATGRAFGFSETRLLREGGRAGDPKTGGYTGPGYPGHFLNPWGGEWPYGDTYEDNANINAGFHVYDESARFRDEWISGNVSVRRKVFVEP